MDKEFEEAIIDLITGPLLKEASGSIAGTAIPPIDEYWDLFAARVQELLRER